MVFANELKRLFQIQQVSHDFRFDGLSDNKNKLNMVQRNRGGRVAALQGGQSVTGHRGQWWDCASRLHKPRVNQGMGGCSGENGYESMMKNRR